MSSAFPVSDALWQRALAVIPGGTHTNSKRVTTLLAPGEFPAYAVRGAGAHLYDADGRRFIDYIAALAPIVLGYGEPRVQARVAAQLADGVLFSLPHPAEVELAETLAAIIPCCDMSRLFKSGAEATSAAVRCARLATGREIILHCGYHGWHDWWTVTLSHAGIPAEVGHLTVGFDFNDLASFERVLAQHGDRAACIVMTPAAYGVEPAPGFLEHIRAAATRRGIVLVFDEIITGFRWALGGAQEKYGVTPDLGCFGKAMANGFPLSALTGRRELMAPLKDNWISTTYSSESLSIVAALETIAILREGAIYPRLYTLAAQLDAGMQSAAKAAGIAIKSGAIVPGLHFAFPGDVAERARRIDGFVRACARDGVLVRRDATGISLCLMAALTAADIAQSLEVFTRAFHEIA